MGQIRDAAAIAGRDYPHGVVTFDGAFRAAYEARANAGSPDVAVGLDAAIPAITVDSVVHDLREPTDIVFGMTPFSPLSNFPDRIDRDVILRVPRGLVSAGDTIEEPLEIGCEPLPRAEFARLSLRAYVGNQVSFGVAFRAVYNALVHAATRDEHMRLMIAAEALGDIAIGNKIGTISKPIVGEEVEVRSRQADLLEPNGGVVSDVGLLLRSRSWIMVRGGTMSPLSGVLIPHPDANYDNYAAMQRSAR